ncbi:MAG: alpha/beta fold hydrolase [Sphingomonadaceae bacterium]
MPIVTVNGLAVEYAQQGAGPDLLLVHSLLTDLTVFERVAPALAAGRRITRIDLPGFGASGSGAFVSVADFADHVAAVMDALELPARTDVFGNGFGAFVALELACRHGARFGRLVVADALAAFPEPARAPFRGMAQAVRAGGMAAVLDTAIGRMFPPAFAEAHPDVIGERKRALARVDAQAFARACLALAELDLAPRLARIANPTLVLCGALDRTTPPELARRLAEHIPGASYREIPDSGHCPMLEQPGTLVDMVLGFLGRSVPVGAHHIHYVEQGRGFPLLLIHGLAGDHTAWTPQIDAWKNRFRVIAPDNRGAGRSSQVDEPVSTADLARDMLALLDRLGVERAHVVGRSMGGAVAQHMALLAPQRVQSLTMCASFARLDPLGRRVLANMREVLEWTRSWPAHARHSVQYFVSPDFFNANPERVAAIEKLIGGETRLQACYVRQNHACQEHDTLERLAEIRCPALILAGGRDPICSPTATRWMSERLRGAETVMFENSSHFFLMEEPERFMRVMDDWLARHTPAAREVA